MDPSVRQSLTNLQGMLDEGFISQSEYAARRKKILDEATTVKPSVAAAAASTSGARSSVFSRLGDGSDATGSTGAETGKWGHDGFTKLYGARKVELVGSNKSSAVRKPLAGAIAKPSKAAKDDLRARLTGAVAKGDLRAKLSGPSSSGGGAAKPMKKLPAKCPW